MKRLLRITAVSICISILAGCAFGVVGGKPALPLSDRNGTERVFAASEAETEMAITNRFADMQYRGMALKKAAGQYLTSGWHPTNGFALVPIMAPAITNVPLKRAHGKSVPYYACFHIVTIPSEPNRTTVVVRTGISEVIDGREPGVHGGWAHHNRKVPPVRQEEENILTAIAEQLASWPNAHPPKPSR